MMEQAGQSALDAEGPEQAMRELAQACFDTLGDRSAHLKPGALLAGEVVFWLVFAFFLLLRWQNPDLWHPGRGGEKPAKDDSLITKSASTDRSILAAKAVSVCRRATSVSLVGSATNPTPASSWSSRAGSGARIRRSARR